MTDSPTPKKGNKRLRRTADDMAHYYGAFERTLPVGDHHPYSEPLISKEWSDPGPAENSEDLEDPTRQASALQKPITTETIRAAHRDVNPTQPKNWAFRPQTCYYWRSGRGGCKYSAEECKYAHHDTGYYASRPEDTMETGFTASGVENARGGFIPNSGRPMSFSLPQHQYQAPPPPHFSHAPNRNPNTVPLPQHLPRPSLPPYHQQSVQSQQVQGNNWTPSHGYNQNRGTVGPMSAQQALNARERIVEERERRVLYRESELQMWQARLTEREKRLRGRQHWG